MRWQGRARSTNVEDRRGMPGGGLAVGGGFGTLAIIVVAMLLGVNPMQLLQQAGPPPGAVENGGGGAPVADSPLQEFTEVILKDTEDVWNAQLRQQLGQEYAEPQLVLFSDSVQSGCGVAGSNVGPFYCPADSTVYLDLRFFETLSEKLGATGDAAMAYVIAHEVGHHIQNQLGINEQVAQRQRGISQEEANQMSVRTELQADYLAGVFFHYAQRSKQILESGDIEEALNAAERIGDDVLTGGKTPESMFTHGKGASRMKWLRRGMQSGSVAREDLMATFETPYNSL